MADDKNGNLTLTLYKLDHGLSTSRREIDAILFIIPVLSTGVGIFGLLTNVVNIMVFPKQGLRDNITVSFLALACSDLASLVALVCLGVALNPHVQHHPDVPFNAVQIVQLTASIPGSFFSRFSATITAYISVERCVSVFKPMKVRLIFTKTLCAVVLVSALLSQIALVSPVYVGARFAWKTHPLTNKTYLGTIPDRRRFYLNMIFLISEVITSITSFLIVGGCAVILIGTLQNRKLWLNKNAIDAIKPEKKLSLNDRKAAKTVTFLAVIFVVCYFLSTANRIVMSSFKDCNRGGLYVNIYYVFVSLGFLTEAIGASVNIFVYLKTNSKYAQTLLSMWHGRRRRRMRNDL